MYTYKYYKHNFSYLGVYLSITLILIVKVIIYLYIKFNEISER